MSWSEKKLLLPFMGAESRTRGQEETRENTGSLGREEPQVDSFKYFSPFLTLHLRL